MSVDTLDADVRADAPVGVGLHDLPEGRYHADPCPEPSLRASSIDTLLTQTPADYAQETPRPVSAGAGGRRRSRAQGDQRAAPWGTGAPALARQRPRNPRLRFSLLSIVRRQERARRRHRARGDCGARQGGPAGPADRRRRLAEAGAPVRYVAARRVGNDRDLEARDRTRAHLWAPPCWTTFPTTAR